MKMPVKTGAVAPGSERSGSGSAGSGSAGSGSAAGVRAAGVRARHCIAGLLFCGLFTADAAAQTLNWGQLSPATSPSASRIRPMAYDSARGVMVLFGGNTASGPIDETWEFDGVDWAQVTTASAPSPRYGHAMVYDSSRGRVVLFGGSLGSVVSLVGDTWEYDGTDWTQVATTTSPAPRVYTSGAYDSQRGRFVLCGGYGGSIYVPQAPNQPIYYADTWEFDGSDWTQVTTATSLTPRGDAACCYDSARGRVVLHGGYYNPYTFGFYLADHWEFDGTDWTQVTTPTMPTARSHHAMAYDIAAGHTIMFGGYGSGTLDDTWQFDGVDWTPLAPTTSPSPRYSGAMSYDSARDRMVMVGGYGLTASGWTYLGDTWVLGAAGSAETYGSGCVGSNGIPALAPASTPSLGQTYSLDATSLAPASLLAFMVTGLSRTSSSIGPLPLDLQPFGLGGGCQLWASVDSTELFAVAGGAGTYNLDIPATQALAGLPLHHQAASIDAGAPGGFAMSNGVRGIVGL